ncbi:hypothetical protein HNP82_001355 [Catenibacillus scindens]|uniref:Uncharacterized protein n=1 Tax=Catenibacillus scindens TaxID=673271 RepID=A0A7W8H9E7_9FIRM|nr:hypothetical protein [Catenibacillus scindens]
MLLTSMSASFFQGEDKYSKFFSCVLWVLLNELEGESNDP